MEVTTCWNTDFHNYVDQETVKMIHILTPEITPHLSASKSVKTESAAAAAIYTQGH